MRDKANRSIRIRIRPPVLLNILRRRVPLRITSHRNLVLRLILSHVVNVHCRWEPRAMRLSVSLATSSLSGKGNLKVKKKICQKMPLCDILDIGSVVLEFIELTSPEVFQINIRPIRAHPQVQYYAHWLPRDFSSANIPIRPDSIP